MVSAPSLMQETLPPLEAGDRLSREDFEQRYEASPHIHKAELIQGVVYLASPTKVRHAAPHARAVLWLGH